ncbi:hypothetical protein DMH08_23640 [Actinomadura sp. WAC 06369]|nr:hypothetical protein DMH08_23640 [Actinomadura sp. WAC 06369]
MTAVETHGGEPADPASRRPRRNAGTAFTGRASLPAHHRPHIRGVLFDFLPGAASGQVNGP